MCKPVTWYLQVDDPLSFSALELLGDVYEETLQETGDPDKAAAAVGELLKPGERSWGLPVSVGATSRG